MNRLLTILLVSISVTSSFSYNLFKSDHDFINLNFNSQIYLLRSSWTFLDETLVNECSITTSQGDIKTFQLNSKSKDTQFKVIFHYLLDSLEAPATRLDFKYTDSSGIEYGKWIRASDANIVYHVSKKLNHYAWTHLDHLIKERSISHTRNGVSMSRRISLSNIDFTGLFAENIALIQPTPLPSSHFSRINHSIRAYYQGRFTSGHWKNLMDESYNHYTTYFIQNKQKTISLTIMTTNQIQ